MEKEFFEAVGHAGNTDDRKILVVSAAPRFSKDIVTYAVHLAERLDYGILALNVDTAFSGERFHWMAVESMPDIEKTALRHGVRCEHRVKTGSVAAAVEQIRREIRRIEMVVTDSEPEKAEIFQNIPIPVFKVIPNTLKEKGESAMSTKIETTQSGHLARVIGYGLATVAMYTAVFMNADTVMTHFTAGGWYAALPIATVFAFSFIHGSFSSHLWSLLGIEAVKKDALRKTEKKVTQPKKRLEKKPRAQAYVNPFHRI